MRLARCCKSSADWNFGENLVTCRYCGHERDLIKAHIIPEGFFRRMLEGGGELFVLSESSDEYPKRAPIGVYDETILCADCETGFGEWDQYAQEILGREPPGDPVFHDDRVLAYEAQHYRYDLLKLFFVSLLWRASVSTQESYSCVQLGPLEDIARRRLVDRDPGDGQEFAVLLAKFAPHPAAEAILLPIRERIRDINYYRFWLGGYVAYIKADRRPTPRAFKDLVLTEARPLKILQRELEESPEFLRMRGTVTAPHNRRKMGI